MEITNREKEYIKSGLDHKFSEWREAFGTKIFYENYSDAVTYLQLIKTNVYLEAELYNVRGVLTDVQLNEYRNSIANLEKHLETPDVINELKKYKPIPFRLEYFRDKFLREHKVEDSLLKKIKELPDLK
jgi:hypothetical protein